MINELQYTPTDSRSAPVLSRGPQLIVIGVLLFLALVAPWRYDRVNDGYVGALEPDLSGYSPGPLLVIVVTAALVAVDEVLTRRATSGTTASFWWLRLLIAVPGLMSLIQLSATFLRDNKHVPLGLGVGLTAAAGLLATDNPRLPAPTRWPWRVAPAVLLACAVAALVREYLDTEVNEYFIPNLISVVPWLMPLLLIGGAALWRTSWVSQVAVFLTCAQAISAGFTIMHSVRPGGDAQLSSRTMGATFGLAVLACALLVGRRSNLGSRRPLIIFTSVLIAVHMLWATQEVAFEIALQAGTSSPNPIRFEDLVSIALDVLPAMAYLPILALIRSRRALPGAVLAGGLGLFILATILLFHRDALTTGFPYAAILAFTLMGALIHHEVTRENRLRSADGQPYAQDRPMAERGRS